MSAGVRARLGVASLCTRHGRFQCGALEVQQTRCRRGACSWAGGEGQAAPFQAERDPRHWWTPVRWLCPSCVESDVQMDMYTAC